MLRRRSENPATRHISLVARHPAGMSRKCPGYVPLKRVAGVIISPRVSVRPHSQHSHERLIEEPVQSLSYCVGIRTMVGIEASASNGRLDFTLAQFDREAPHSLSSPFAVPTHALSAGERAHGGGQGSGYRGIIGH